MLGFLSFLALLPNVASAAPQSAPTFVIVDAREAARGVFHTRVDIPSAPGDLKLYFPKYMPGEHGPNGRISNMANLHFRAGAQELKWSRDLDDVFTFHVTVPNGVKTVTATFDHLKGHGAGSQNLCRLSWHEVLLYKAGPPSDQQIFGAQITLPEGWKCSTALTQIGAVSGTANFGITSLTRLVDSPCLMGKFYKQYDVTAADGVKNTLEVYGESPEKIVISQADLDGMKRMVGEFAAQAGSRHYRSYQFLLSFSHAAGAGLEHNESSEDGMGEDCLASESQRMDLWDLLGHEGFHSWNGKFRRPVGLCTPDYEVPYRDDLLWVYEGMTEFYGNVMPTRAGLWTQEYYRENAASFVQRLKATRGRNWRTIVDTTFLPLMSGRGVSGWTYAMRSVDYYYEMVPVWLEVDMRIRTLTNGAKSLSDFCRMFHGGPNNGPEIKSYDFDEVVQGLNQVAPYDWAGLLRERVYSVQPEVPMGGFEMAGWKYVENDEPNKSIQGQEARGEFTYFAGSIGVNLKASEIVDLVPNSAADTAGLAPGWKIVSVNGLKFSDAVLKDAVKAGGKIELMVERDRDVQPYTLNYSGGLKYPHLERIAGKPDRMAEMLKPLGKG